MSGITLQSASLGDMGESITEDHFGTNFLFHTDRVGDGTDFSGVAKAVNAGLLRYPGGTVTEEYFDLGNPMATVQDNIMDVLSGQSTVRQRDVEPLHDFLSYCRDTGTKAIIVLPTYRYFDAATGGLTQDAEAEIKGFIEALMRGDYGNAEIHSLEIGNEWYQTRFDWSVSEFGALQAQMAVWVDQAIAAAQADYAPDIYLQAGRNDFDNEILSGFNTGDAAEAVDGVIAHFYATNSTGNVLAIGGGVDRRLKDIAEHWNSPGAAELDLVVTEWNVGESGEDTTLINGLMRTAPLLRVFTEMIENGVDMATIWSAQTHGSAGLSTREGDGSELRPTGHLMQMLSDALVDTTMQITPDGPNLYDDTGDHVGYTYVFEGANTTVVYFASGVGRDLDFTVDFDAYMTETTLVSATVLGAAAGTTGIEYDARAELREMFDITLTQDATGNWSYDFTLDDYELIQFEFIEGSTVQTGQTVQETPSIQMFVAAQTSQFVQRSGTDNADIIHGDIGNDTLDGGRDDDHIYGSVGDDMLTGGHGRDMLDGGVGNDILSGGNWHDTLLGGDGDDLLMPGKGADVVDGGQGNDTISYEDADVAVQINLSDGSADISGQRDKLSSIENATGSMQNDALIGNAQDNILIGLDGDDTIDGGRGNDLLIGGSGSDRFVFNIQSGNDRIDDFDTATDVIDLTQFGSSAADVSIEQIGADTRLSLYDFELILTGVEHGEGEPAWVIA